LATAPAALDLQRRSKRALTYVARHKYGDVTEGNASPGGDAFPRRQLDRGSTARAGDPADLGDPDQPPVGLASDLNLEALTDRQEVNPTRSALDTGTT
jgi:hypothetical protein